MEKNSENIVEDSRDKRLLEQIRLMLDERFSGLNPKFASIDQHFVSVDQRFTSIDQHFVTIDENFAMLDQRFEAIDQSFAAIHETFLAMDQRFVSIDQRFVAIDEKLVAMDQKISALQLGLIDVQEKVGALSEESVKVRETLDRHTAMLDAISHRMSKWDTEFPIMSHVVLGLDRWATAAAPKIGLKYVREEQPKTYPSA
jgi:septation ring formation regulator EzrA